MFDKDVTNHDQIPDFSRAGVLLGARRPGPPRWHGQGHRSRAIIAQSESERELRDAIGGKFRSGGAQSGGQKAGPGILARDALTGL